MSIEGEDIIDKEMPWHNRWMTDEWTAASIEGEDIIDTMMTWHNSLMTDARTAASKEGETIVDKEIKLRIRIIFRLL